MPFVWYLPHYTLMYIFLKLWLTVSNDFLIIVFIFQQLQSLISKIEKNWNNSFFDETLQMLYRGDILCKFTLVASRLMQRLWVAWGKGILCIEAVCHCIAMFVFVDAVMTWLGTAHGFESWGAVWLFGLYRMQTQGYRFVRQKSATQIHRYFKVDPQIWTFYYLLGMGFGYYTGCHKKERLIFRYCGIRKYSIFDFIT